MSAVPTKDEYTDGTYSIMHAHTRAQLAAATSPPVVSASPNAQVSNPVIPAKVSSPNSLPAVAPPQASESPVASNQTTVVKEPSLKSNSSSSSSSSGFSGEEDGEEKKTPAEFDAGKLYIPVKVRSSPGGITDGLVGADAHRHRAEEQDARRKSEGGCVSVGFGRDWGRKEDGMWVIPEGGDLGTAEGKDRRGSVDSTRHAKTRLRCDCEDCEACRMRKGLLAKNGLCMTDPSLMVRRETV